MTTLKNELNFKKILNLFWLVSMVSIELLYLNFFFIS
jgi:hypothetical protein